MHMDRAGHQQRLVTQMNQQPQNKRSDNAGWVTGAEDGQARPPGEHPCCCWPGRHLVTTSCRQGRGRYSTWSPASAPGGGTTTRPVAWARPRSIADPQDGSMTARRFRLLGARSTVVGHPEAERAPGPRRRPAVSASWIARKSMGQPGSPASRESMEEA